MPVPPVDPWRELDELDAFRRRDEETRTLARDRAGRMSPEAAFRVARIASAWDWVSPGFALALANDGRQPTDPTVVAAAREAARQRTDSALGWAPPGTPVNIRTEFGRDAARARNAPRQIPPPTNPAARTAFEQANVGGLVGPGGFLVEPEDEDGPKAYLWRQVRQAYLDANEPLPVVMNGRPAIVTRKERTQSGNAWITDIEYLVDEPERESSGGGVGPGGINIGVQRAGVSGTAALNQGVQTALMGLNAPVQEVVGLARAAYSGEAPSFQSDLAVRVTNPELPAGGGYFVDEDSPLAQERRAREERYGQIGGHNLSVGRIAANAIGLQPDTQPFRILSGIADAGVQLFADPTNMALGGAGKIEEARKLIRPDVADDALEAVGGIRGMFRNVVDSPTVSQALTGELRPVIDAWATQTSPMAILRDSKWKLPPEMAVRIADDAHTGDEVAAIVRPALGIRVRKIDDLAAEVRPKSRWRSNMPNSGFDPTDRTDTLRTLDGWMNATGVDVETRTGVLDSIARAQGQAGVYDGTQQSAKAVDASLAASGVSNPVIRSKLTRLWADSHEDARHYFVNELGEDVPVWSKVNAGGEVIDTPGPHLMTELLTTWVDLPDVRAARSLTTTQRKILAGDDTVHRAARFLFATTTDEGQTRGVPSALHAITNNMWKPAQLLRAAWPIRVVGDEQGRMVAKDLDAMFNHPRHFIAWRIGRAQTDMLGNAWDEAEQFNDAMAKARQWTGSRTVLQSRDYTVYQKSVHEHDAFLDAAAAELGQLAGDPLARQVAKSPTLDDAVEWYTRGDGNQFRQQMLEGRPELADDLAARRYVQTVADRIHIKTGNDTELIDAIASGRWGKVDVIDRNTVRVTPQFRKQLEAKWDVLPERVKGRVTVENPYGTRAGQQWRRFVDWAFSALMTQRTNNLSRSPTFRQYYWREGERLVQFGDEAAKAKVVQAAKDANLSRRAIARIEKVTPGGDLSVEDIDYFAKGFALDETKHLLFDLSMKGQTMDAMRLVFPFGDAWREVVTTWGRLLNPLTPDGLRRLHRIDQGISGLRGEGLGAVTGAPEIYNPETGEMEQQGLFWRNEFGEEVGYFPFTAAATKALLGVPIPMTGRVQGLNMVGTVVPGIGPALQVPVSWFTSTRPEWSRAVLDAKVPVTGDTVEETILPFGGPLSEGDVNRALSPVTYLPSWAQRLITGLTRGAGDPNGERMWAGSVMQMARYLDSTGDYGHTPEEMQRLMDDAADKAQGLYLIRALGSFGLPTAPAPDWMVEDSTGNLRRTLALTEELNDMRDENIDTAVDRFLARYGEDVLLLTESLSRSDVRGVDPTQEFRDWAEAHADLKRDLPNVYALFGPQNGEFSGAVYNQQFASGERETQSTEDWLRGRNNTLGWMEYERYRAQLPENPSRAQRAWLDNIEEAIHEEYPGWRDQDRTKASTETMVRELVQAAERTEVRSTDAGQALVTYLEYRQQAMEQAEGAGLKPTSFATAKRMRNTRVWLRGIGEALVDENPSFSPVWRALENEMNDDETDVAA